MEYISDDGYMQMAANSANLRIEKLEARVKALENTITSLALFRIEKVNPNG